MLVAIDTQTLIWGFRQVASTGQEEMVVRARTLLEDLKSKGDKIVLAAEVIAEYLSHYEDHERAGVYDLLKKHFLIAAFDMKAAHIAARILKDRFKVTQRQLTGDGTSTRQCLKSDAAIIAAARAFDATLLYTDDGEMRTMAEGTIETKGLPPLPFKQPSLNFPDEES